MTHGGQSHPLSTGHAKRDQSLNHHLLKSQYIMPRQSNKKPLSNDNQASWSVNALEQRIMLAGDVAAEVSVISNNAPAIVSNDHKTSDAVSAQSITFIDAELEDLSAFVDAIPSSTEIVLITNDSDPISQISQTLATKQNVQSVHLIGHGDAGQVSFGNHVVDSDALREHSSEIRTWQNALSSEADILIYGCNTGQSNVGSQFMSLLAQLTSADIAASTDVTGNAKDGGDWKLEKAIGHVDTSLVLDTHRRKDLDVTLATVRVFAAGTTGDERIELQIGGDTVATYNDLGSGADSGSFRTRTFTTGDNVTADQVRIEFVNDLYDPANGIDRNVRIDAIEIDGVRYETESPDVFSNATYTAGGIEPGFGRGDTLHSNGYFQYSGGDGNQTEITVNAAGAEGTESFALQIDGQTVQTWDNINTVISSYRYTANGTVTADQIRVVFLNDQYDPANGIDANLIVDDIVVGNVQYETEASNVFSTGTWFEGDIVDGFGRGDTLHANGYFQYSADDPGGNAGFVGLGDTQATVNENDGSVQIEVIRFDGSSGPATVFYQTLGATANDGSDFVGVTNGQVSFADGQTSAFITVDLLNDNVVEPVETFSISLSRVEGAELNVPRTALVTIIDDEDGGGLIGHWRLDETQIGQTVVDSSGNGNYGVHRNITSPNGPTTDRPDTDTPNPRGVNFDGSDDFIQIGQDASLELSSGTFTQSVWIRPENSDNGYNGILGFQASGTSAAARYPGIWVYQKDRIHAGFGDGTNWNSFLTDSVLTEGQWNHVATTYDGTSYIAYVNGVRVYSSDQFAGRSPVISGQVNIGRVDNFFEGGIDDVRIYDRALSFTEITELIDGATVPDVPFNSQVVSTQIRAGFNTPIETEFLPDGRILVAEQAGLVRIINQDGSIASTPLLDIRNIVNAGTKDRGMIGFAVHPDFENNPYIYASFTYDPPETAGQSGLAGPDGNGARVARISRFTVNAAGTFADPNSEVVLVGGNSTFENIGDSSVRPGSNDPYSCFDAAGNHIQDCIPADETSHTIGELEFGPDGALYVASGDGGAFGRVEVRNIRALDLDSLAGKILRIDPITGQGLSDNPFYDGDANSNRSKVFATGLRNPFRFAISDDAANPSVYIGDVGWTQWEEVNVAQGGENFGWPAYEGGDGNESFETGRYDALSEIQAFYASNPDVVAPEWARSHSDGGRAIVMGDIASDRYGELAGSLFFTDIGDQIIRAARLDSAGAIVGVEVVSGNLGFIVDLETNPADGYMYYTDITGNIGRLELA